MQTTKAIPEYSNAVIEMCPKVMNHRTKPERLSSQNQTLSITPISVLSLASEPRIGLQASTCLQDIPKTNSFTAKRCTAMFGIFLRILHAQILSEEQEGWIYHV
jgi:hypothetical protein